MRLALAAGALLLVAACAGVSPPPGPGPGSAAPPQGPLRVTQTLQLAGGPVQAEWHLPASESAPASGLVTLQHGFSRQCSHLRGTARALAEAGAATLCLETSMAGGNPALARDFAALLAAPDFAPPGRPRPARIVVAGFSAGAHFAVVLGAQLVELVPGQVAGAVLLDPVAARGFEPALQRLAGQGSRPVLSIAAQASGCNARHNAHPALRRLREASQGFAGVVFGEGSTHMDAEGEDTDLLAYLACGRQWPQARTVAQLRELAACWARGMLDARAPAADGAPGRGCAQALLDSGTVQELR